MLAGALITRGNSNTEAYSVGFDALRRTDADRFTLYDAITSGNVSICG